jgi:hypothetical protein
MGFNKSLHHTWEKRVNSRYMFRGMSRKDLTFPLDPKGNPFAEAASKISEFLDMLLRVVDAGFRFKVVEQHWGQAYEHDLRDIVTWSKRDLANGGLDFTAHYQAAREYADNWQGSQLKQNLKYVTNHLPECVDNALLATIFNEEDWNLLHEVKQWISEESLNNRGIVLWVRRSCPVFEPTDSFPFVGTFDSFQKYILKKVKANDGYSTVGHIIQTLPTESEDKKLWIRLQKPLLEEHVEKIEEIRPAQTDSADG